jgi:acetylglutamate kinase
MSKTLKVKDSEGLKNASDNSKDSIRAEILMQALPYIKDFSDETFVIKYGGSAIGNNPAFVSFVKNVCLLKSVGINIIIVHGGGPQIDVMLKRLNIPSNFIDGLRVTDLQTMEIVESVLCGSINKYIVEQISKCGQKAIGLSGKDYDIITAEKMNSVYRKQKSDTDKVEELVNLGFVGKPHIVNSEFFNMFQDMDFIPVLAPVALGKDGYTYNMNADTVAGSVAVAVDAKKLILLTDTDGIYDSNGERISSIDNAKAKELISQGVIKGGMIPKIETALAAVENGVGSAHIINGLKENSLLLEILTSEGTGTMIVE